MEAGGQKDWQVDRTVLQCNKYMLDHQINCDVTFWFGRGMAFPSFAFKFTSAWNIAEGQWGEKGP